MVVRTILARRYIGTIARNHLVPPKADRSHIKWYMNLADTAQKAVVVTCLGVTLYFGAGVAYMFWQSRQNKGELRKRLIEAGVIDTDGKQLLHRLQGEDSWLGKIGITKREDLEKRIEDKATAKEIACAKAKQDLLALEKANMDRSRVGIFDPADKALEENRRRREEAERDEDEASLDPRIGVFARTLERKEGGGSWFGWLRSWKSGEQKQVEAELAAKVEEKK